MECPTCRAPGMCICADQKGQAPCASAPVLSLWDVLSAVGQEVGRASAKFAPFHSAHEGFAILMEEVEELKAHVWTNQERRDIGAMSVEAIQVAAMAVRFAMDVCNEAGGRN